MRPPIKNIPATSVSPSETRIRAAGAAGTFAASRASTATSGLGATKARPGRRAGRASWRCCSRRGTSSTAPTTCQGVLRKPEQRLPGLRDLVHVRLQPGLLPQAGTLRHDGHLSPAAIRLCVFPEPARPRASPGRHGERPDGVRRQRLDPSRLTLARGRLLQLRGSGTVRQRKSRRAAEAGLRPGHALQREEGRPGGDGGRELRQQRRLYV